MPFPCELIKLNFVVQQSLIMKFCSHDCGSSRLGSKLEACKLVIPFSNFICKGESLLISSMLKFWNGPEEVGSSQGQNRLFCDGFSYPGWTKKLISSEDLDFVLVGTIKTSSLSGRLQLVDSTGCVDVIIPDLPSNESLYGIYEVITIVYSAIFVHVNMPCNGLP